MLSKKLIKCQVLKNHWLGVPGEVVFLAQGIADRYETKGIVKVLDPRIIDTNILDSTNITKKKGT